MNIWPGGRTLAWNELGPMFSSWYWREKQRWGGSWMGAKYRNTHYYSLKSSTYASKPVPKLWRGCALGLCLIQGPPLTAAPFLTQWVRNSRNWHTGWPCPHQQSKHFIPPLWGHCLLPAMSSLLQLLENYLKICISHDSSLTGQMLTEDILKLSRTKTIQPNLRSLKTYFLSHVHIQICQIMKVELTVHLR